MISADTARAGSEKKLTKAGVAKIDRAAGVLSNAVAVVNEFILNRREVVKA